jgi:hypothetical protein
MRDPLLTARVEEYVERSREHHRRLIRWAASVFPLPLMFGPRLIDEMSRSVRTDIIYTYAGLVAVLGVGVCLSAWRFDRTYGVRCPECGAKLSASPELFLRVGECPRCAFQRARAAG